MMIYIYTVESRGGKPRARDTYAAGDIIWYGPAKAMQKQNHTYQLTLEEYIEKSYRRVRGGGGE